jgi:sulfate adenylyltransferase
VSELNLNRTQYLEFEKLAMGAFQPLQGFMNEDEFRSSVETMRLPGGSVFPLPIILDLDADQARSIRGRNRVSLVFGGEEVGELSPESIFTCDQTRVARQVFGTDDVAHPGVAHFLGMGSLFVGGPVRLSRRARIDLSADELTPQACKGIFAERGWRTVVGFQTRNVPHRAHEYLQRVALEHVDGLFIQPLVGRKKVGDYTPDAIMTGYRALIANFYPPKRVVLGILSTAMRYAGPREAVFHAVVRRNYGCTHFVVGRDHAGVGNYYGKYESHELVRRFDGELGIKVMTLHGPYHCRICDGIVTEQTCPHLEAEPSATTEISGTLIRAMLTNGVRPQSHIMRPEIIGSLKGVRLFVEESDL